MNILLLNHYAGSPEMGMEFRPYYMAREWTKMGHHVSIIAGDFSHLRVKNPRIEQDFERKEINGIDYYWIRTGDYRGNGVRRALSMFRFVGKLWLNAGKIAKEGKPDVVIASSTYPLDTYAAQRIAKKSKAKLIHEVHDMWPATLYEVGGMSKHNPFVILMQLAENSAYRNSDRVVSLLPYAKEYMIKHGMRANKFVHIANGVVKSEWDLTERLPDIHVAFFKKAHERGNFIVGYFGGHALSNALDTFLNVAKKMRDSSEILFVLVGDGVEKERLEKRKADEQLDNVTFLPPVPKKAVPGLVWNFDCVYMGGVESPLYRFGLCLNKMYDSMMSGKPIICAFTTPQTIIDKYQCGFTIDSGDIKGIMESITAIKNMSTEKRREMGENGRKAVLEHFTYEKLAADFAALF